MTDEIYFDDDEINAANSWHGGGGSMLYAIASTGALRPGTHRPRVDGREMADDEWMRHLAEKLEDEANDAARHAGADAKRAKGAEKKELLADKRALQSIALKAASVHESLERKAGRLHATKRQPKYGKKTSEKVERTMREFKEGTLRSSSGQKVTSRKQALAIGLSQARARGYKVPPAHAKMLSSPPVRVEDVIMPNGTLAEIHIHHGKGGYAGVLVFPNGKELPMSLGVPVPHTAAEAVRGAKKFLATVYGRRN
jgi:hypothetical protein